jgi:hypothetical protein
MKLWKLLNFFFLIYWEMVGAGARARARAGDGAGAETLDTLEPELRQEPQKNRPAPQYCLISIFTIIE